MRIIQLRSFLSSGDGICNTIVMMDKVLSKRYSSIIAVKGCDAEYVNHPRITIINSIDELCISTKDIVIYPYGEYDELGVDLLGVECKRILLYQNVTYPLFYGGIDNAIAKNCAEGQRYVRNAIGSFLKVIAPSQFSYNELVNMGWNRNDVYRLSLPVTTDKRGNTTNKKSDERKFLFVGRIVPNKKIEDVVRVFDYYRRHYYKNSTLKIAGSFNNDVYYDTLIKYIKAKNIANVEFLGHITDGELEELYISSDVFLCMSEHEGFCIPLIEAMSCRIPVVAYSATAVPDTMGDAGILLDNKDAKYVCDKIDKLFEDEQYRSTIIDGQIKHVDEFIKDDYEEKLFGIIEEIIDIETYEYDNSRIEFYEMLLREIKDRDDTELIDQINRIMEESKGIVIYGMGKVGKELLEILEIYHINVDSICDYNKAGEDYNGYTILSPSECVKRYSESVFIITIQNKVVIAEVIDALKELGVSSNNMFFYSNSFKKILA